jgi:ribosomal-protein-alanine N-acetyltransferase
MSAIIRTARLSLQPLTLDDLDSIHALWTNPGVRLFLFDDQIISREQAAAELNESIDRFEAHGCGLWGARLREQPELIGFCGFRFFHDPPQLQLLYGFHPDHWSKGFATEAARAMIRFGFERAGLDSVIASADAPNLASLGVMERAGMSFDRRETVNEMDTVYYRLDRRDFSPDTTFYEVSHSDLGNNSKEAS